MTKIRLSLIAAATLCFGAVACSSTATPTDPAAHPTAATRTPTAATAQAAPTTTTKAPPAVSAEQRNATATAQDYLQDQAFSRKGLIEQLKYEGYSTKASTAAVDSLDVDWNAQAEASAKDYLSSQAFSRSGLIGQLEFEGFSKSQATYGVKKAGL